MSFCSLSCGSIPNILTSVSRTPCSSERIVFGEKFVAELNEQLDTIVVCVSSAYDQQSRLLFFPKTLLQLRLLLYAWED